MYALDRCPFRLMFSIQLFIGESGCSETQQRSRISNGWAQQSSFDCESADPKEQTKSPMVK